MSNFGAVILAAGMSRRMGSAKALLDFDGRPLIQRLIETVRDVKSITEIVVVTGHQPDAIQRAIAEPAKIRFVHNDHFESGGMFSSVRAGVATVAGATDAFFLMLLDQPLVQSGTLQAMLDAWQQRRPAFLAPAFSGKRGHPLLIATTCGGAIVSLPPSASLHDFVEQHRSSSEVIELNDPGVVTDVDTPGDYQAVLRLWRTRTCPAVPIETSRKPD